MTLINWARKHKTTLSVFGAMASLAILSNWTLSVSTVPGDVGGLTCDALRLEQADGQQLIQLIDQSGLSFLDHIENEAGKSRMGRFFVRALIWCSGGRAEAETIAAHGHQQHMALLAKEIANRYK